MGFIWWGDRLYSSNGGFSFNDHCIYFREGSLLPEGSNGWDDGSRKDKPSEMLQVEWLHIHPGCVDRIYACPSDQSRPNVPQHSREQVVEVFVPS
jgi:hypothetical protein